METTDEKPMATGRDADVFALDETRVLRRYRGGASAEPEAAIMVYLAGHGFPVPAVHRADGPDLILERLYGPTLLAALMADTATVTDAAAILADLQSRLHQVPPQPGADGPVLHLDLHPDNIMLTDRGPVLIDWRNARSGAPELDLAVSALILAQVAVSDWPIAAMAGTLLDEYLSRIAGDPLSMLDDAARMRRGDPNMSTVELDLIDAAAQLVRERAAPAQPA